MIKNANFSQGTGGTTHQYLYNASGPTGQTFDNIHAPTDWVFYWLENAPGTDPASLTGRPEAQPIYRPDFPDPVRFLPDHDYTFKAFTFWRNHHMGIGQTVKATPGNLYTWSINAHAWYSQCSTKPHDPPLEEDCQTSLYWAKTTFALAIDPTGGQNPFDPDLQWISSDADYGRFASLHFVSMQTEAAAPYITLWFKSVTSHSLKHCDIYLSAAKLIETPGSEPDPSDCIKARIEYDRTMNVVPSDISRARYLEICADIFDNDGLQSLGPSYDDAAIGDGLKSKSIRLWDIEPDRRTDFLDFYNVHYPARDYTITFVGDDDTDPPPVPSGEPISLHIQTETRDLFDFIGNMHAAGNPLGWVKLVMGFETSHKIRAVSPNTKILARQINEPQLWEDPVKQAKAILDAVWPAMVVNPVHALETTNERFGTSNTTAEILDMVALEVALSNDIKRRSDILYAETGRTVIGVLGSLPVGNLQHGAQTALLQEMVDTCARNGHGIAYHPYFPATLDPEVTWRWLLTEGYHHHLRLQLSWSESLDGLFEIPIFYNEGGPIGCTVRDDGRPGSYNAHAGWRYCVGSWPQTIQYLLKLRELILAAPGGHRVETYTLFTTGDPNIIGWDEFIIGPGEYPLLQEALT